MGAYQSIFSQEEKVSHIKAADAIIGYVAGWFGLA